MRVALVDTMQKPQFYPVGLLKIASWQKSLGNQCTLFSNTLPDSSYDAAFVGTTFTFEIPRAIAMIKKIQERVKNVTVGGISATLLPHKFEDLGVTVCKGLHPDAETFCPDYSVLPEPPTYSICHTSRGCIRKCEFCMVRVLEPRFYNKDWVRDLAPKTNKIVFYDNNWLAKKREDLEADVAILKSLKSRKLLVACDFNQSLDARLMTQELADLISGIPFSPVRFAFDGMQEDRYFQNAVTMMAGHGYKNFIIDVLWNFNDSPEDLYYRLREHSRLTEELSLQLKGNVEVKAFPMLYRPIMEIDTEKEYIGRLWTNTEKQGFWNLMNHGPSNNGCLTLQNLREFEYWFGKDSNAFLTLINYPHIKKLCERKRANTRFNRKLDMSNPFVIGSGEH
jgi:hypothetical protein